MPKADCRMPSGADVSALFSCHAAACCGGIHFMNAGIRSGTPRAGLSQAGVVRDVPWRIPADGIHSPAETQARTDRRIDSAASGSIFTRRHPDGTVGGTGVTCGGSAPTKHGTAATVSGPEAACCDRARAISPTAAASRHFNAASYGSETAFFWSMVTFLPSVVITDPDKAAAEAQKATAKAQKAVASP